jgi:hypothetical protein
MITWKFSEIKKNPNFPLTIFLCFYLLFTLITFRDYGIADDEDVWYTQALRYVKHYVHQTTDLDESGGIFSVEQASHNYIYPGVLRVLFPKKAEIYHLANLLLAIPVYLVIYGCLLVAYRKRWMAFLGPVFLFLFFRFTGDVPINPKDGPFAVYYFFGLGWIYLSRYRIKDIRVEVLVLGVVIGLATTIRAVGITLLPILVIYRFYEYWADQRTAGRKINLRDWVAKEWLNFTLVFIVSQCWIMAFWPYLGSNYFGNILNILLQSKAYAMNYPMLFMGQVVSSLTLPWYYLVVWFGICTPLFILVFFISSFFLFNKKVHSMEGRLYFLLAFTFIFHLFLYIGLRPVIYNSMRHYLFIAPILSVMATMGFIEFFHSRISKMFKRSVLVLVGLNILLVLIEFCRLYPYHYVYFNELVGGLKGAAGRYETEYWSSSFKEATQWLEKNELTDPNRVYHIKIGGAPWQEIYYFKPNMVADQTPGQLDYEIVEPRIVMPPLEPNQEQIYAVTREGVPFVTIRKFNAVPQKKS